jgi:hypothetical protein
LARLGGKQRGNKGRTKIHVTKRKASMLRALMWDPDNIDRSTLLDGQRYQREGTSHAEYSV